MGRNVAHRILKVLSRGDRPISACKVGVLGLTFKEDVPDTRNSRVPDIVDELKEYGVQMLVDDAFASERDIQHLGLERTPFEQWDDLDALILAVPHRPYLDVPATELLRGVRAHGLIFDVKSKLDRGDVPEGMQYLAL